VRPVGGGAFELVHPPAIEEVELDYVEGAELAAAGEVDEARETLRYALEACGENLWVHVALGRLALEAGRDPALARGHFGYAFELVERALPPGFDGRLPRDLPANAPFFEAAEGLAACYEALGRPGEAVRVRSRAARLGGD
jgi:tetratricopeptide (TPR) repeat protein